MVPQLTQEQIEEYREIFNLFDKDHSGSISGSELTSVMRSLGLKPTESEVTDLMNEIDLDGNHQIEFDEFLVLMSRQQKSNDSKEELLEAFKVFDVNGDGYISRSELKQVLTSIGENLSEQEIDDMMKEVGDGKGRIDINQFAAMLSK
ncbi:hypothetical protein TBLA_0H01560 [Henningerozyma blattae CBS 6284]|uniref:EF-hand domain-containing protein n=1 Tax=Henningerozyma blattae (strain ATCC 34711 / CBS 6284 / DSM 70876 / NBRC 10599 / NRRL Y-10934 / UCD 77-7) TaxID=1071380 RepID=I2H7U1_HENB6|nr:hypothetical protein TBLA_0H01560 [Tetrapisispora blattae CBS 6284]CCH62443.1 hypothetical protein TBLA_0H01560 [Tetrapisispora blattae CBS 6284]